MPNSIDSSEFLKHFELLANKRSGLTFYVRAFHLRYPDGRKWCSACEKSHPISKFRVRTPEKGLLRALCSKVELSKGRAIYEKNKPDAVARSAKNKAFARNRNRQYAQSYLQSSCCSSCDVKTSADNPLKFFMDSSTCDQTVSMAVGGGLSLDSVDVAISRSQIICRNCLGNKSRRQLSDLWSLRDRLGVEYPGAKVHSLFKKDVYRAYRRAQNISRGLPVTNCQAKHLRVLAKKVSKGKDIILMGQFDVFESTLREHQLNLPEKKERSQIRTLRKSLTCSPDL